MAPITDDHEPTTTSDHELPSPGRHRRPTRHR